MQATVLQMLRIGTARDAILDMLVNLHDNEWLGEREAKDLKQYVLACTNALQDSSSMFPTPNQRIIQSRELFAGTKRSKEQLQQIVDTSTAKMEMVYSDKHEAYVHWTTAGNSRPPSQALALDQLKLRFTHAEPIVVCLYAGAGYGKSEVIAAWTAYTELHNEKYMVVSPTGVAATQVGG